MRLSEDKILHAEICAVITLVVSIIAGIFNPGAAWFIGCFVAMLVGVAKEAYDYYHHNLFSIGDIYADAIGIVVGSGIYVLLGKICGW